MRHILDMGNGMAQILCLTETMVKAEQGLQSVACITLMATTSPVCTFWPYLTFAYVPCAACMPSAVRQPRTSTASAAEWTLKGL